MPSLLLSAAKCRGLIEAAGPSALAGDVLALSAAKCRGLIEAQRRAGSRRPRRPLSAAKCRGLIEAPLHQTPKCRPGRCYPRRNAAASLKPMNWPMALVGFACYPRRNAAASLKPLRPQIQHLGLLPLSAAKCRGLIEAIVERSTKSQRHSCYPRRNAAASLKLIQSDLGGALVE